MNPESEGSYCQKRKKRRYLKCAVNVQSKVKESTRKKKEQNTEAARGVSRSLCLLCKRLKISQKQFLQNSEKF
jgi:hypothetical protein